MNRAGRSPSERDAMKLEQAARLIIEAVGDDPNRPDLLDTPRRFRDAWLEMTTPRGGEPTAFDSVAPGGMVVVRNIVAWSVCEHHLMPFRVEATIGVVPGAKILGLSKYARIVDDAARRLGLQERLTEETAGAIEAACDPEGVAVLMRGRHLCMCARGVRQDGSETTTIAWRGSFTQPALRTEFLGLLGV